MRLESRENRIYQFDKMRNFMISLGYALVSHPNPFASVVDYRGCCVSQKQRETAKEQRRISLFFHPPSQQKSKVSAANAMPLADNFLPEQRKTAKLE
jgi:hypothetical protein